MTATEVISPAQFTGGPAEAKSIASPEPDRSWGPKPQGHQGQLLDPKSTPLLAAHHQTPEQFAKDPRTWFHGRFTSAKSRLGGGQGREGFHAGTEGAARTRLKANAGLRASKPGVGGHLFPLRITGPVDSPQNLHPDEKVHRDLGPAYNEWGQTRGGRRTGYLYENVVEGGISVGTPQRKGFLSTHKEMVQSAQKSGEYVHPLIDWASKKATEHTGETYPEEHRYSATPNRQLQMSGGGMAEAREKNTTHRTTYTTEGGRKKGVFRFSEDAGPNGALSPRQWSPSG